MNKDSWLKLLVIIIIFLMALYIIGGFTGWWAAETTTEADETQVNVYDFYNNVEVDADDHEIYLYRTDITNLTLDEIKDLTFSDYSLHTTMNSGGTYTPDLDKYQYCIKVNGSDIVERWVENLRTGVYDVYVANATEDVAMACVSVDELAIGIVNTTYDEWYIHTQCLDGAEGTGSATEKEGYRAYDDFEDDAWNSIVLRITFNTTAAASYVDLKSDIEHDTVVSGTYVYFEMHTDIIGYDTFKIDFSSAVGLNGGATVQCSGAAIGYGSGASFTAWDTYTMVAA